MPEHKKTRLHGYHLSQGARMASFADYQMPLWYPTGVKAEHLAVIQNAGIFDTSHMAAVTLRGEGARETLQHCLSKDLETCIGRDGKPLFEGRCVYGVFLNPDGTVIDDAIVYQLQPEKYMVVVNAGMGGKIASLLRESAPEETVVENLTDAVGKMDIQGPKSALILRKIIKDPDVLFEKMVYFSFKGGFGSCISKVPIALIDGTPVLVSRTGYTGEFGFELFVEIDRLQSLWDHLLEAGREYGMLPCGLAARDSLRAGAVLPLSHQDIGPWPFLSNPWQFALPWNADGSGFSKDFVGADALLEETETEHTLPFTGFDPRKISDSHATCVILPSGEKIGKILTCTTDMAIDRVDGEIVSLASGPKKGGTDGFKTRGLCCGFLLVNRKLGAGEIVYLSDGKRKLKVEIRADIRPDRSARYSLKALLGEA